MLKYLALFVLLAINGGGLRAQTLVYRHEGDVLRLSDGPCPADIAALVPEPFRDRLQEASSVIDGKTFRGCWLLRSDDQVAIKWEDGDGGLVPWTHFKPEFGV